MPKPLVAVRVLCIWCVGVLLSAYAMRDILDERFREDWGLIAMTITSALALFVDFLRWISKLAVSDNKICHINHGTSYHNSTAGGMINFGSIILTPHLETQQTDPAAMQEKFQNENP